MVNHVHPRADLRLLYSLAAMQHGVVGRTQLIAFGMSWRAVDRRLQSGEFRRLLPGVYAFRVTPESYDQLLMAACIWSSGHASHRAAAAKHDLPGMGRARILEISTSRTLSHQGLIVHKRNPLPACDLTRVDGVPVTAAHRTLLDLGAVASEAAVEIALDDALRRGLTSLPQLRWHLANAGGRGVRGTAVIRRILEARREDRGVCHSPLETIARRLFRKSSLPTPVKQYPVTDSGKFLGRVDFAYPDCKIAIEVVGWDFHSGRRRWEKDLRRRTSLESRGWMVLEFTWDEIMNQPDLVIETIHRALTSRSFPDYTRSASA
jgi:hypothetical protein